MSSDVPDPTSPFVLWAGLIDGTPSRMVALPGKRLRAEELSPDCKSWVPGSFDAGAIFVNPPCSKLANPFNSWDPPSA
jgi:hypothetical protein